MSSFSIQSSKPGTSSPTPSPSSSVPLTEINSSFNTSSSSSLSPNDVALQSYNIPIREFSSIQEGYEYNKINQVDLPFIVRNDVSFSILATEINERKQINREQSVKGIFSIYSTLSLFHFIFT